MIFFIGFCQTKMYLLKTKNDKNYLVNTKAKHIHEEESNDEEESFNFFESSGDPENDESDNQDHVLEDRNDSLAKLTEEMENIERGVRPSVGNIRINENTLQDIVNKNSEGETGVPTHIWDGWFEKRVVDDHKQQENSSVPVLENLESSKHFSEHSVFPNI